MKILLVFLGGGLGSVCRYAVSVAMARSGSPLPWATLLVNVLGCLLIGLLAQTLAPDSVLRALFIAGFGGGFTTFSTFVNEGSALGRDDHFAWLALYIIGSLAVGFLCLLAGNSLAKALQ